MKRKIASFLAAIFIVASFGTVANAEDSTSKNSSSKTLVKAKTVFTKAFEKAKDGKQFFVLKNAKDKLKKFNENFKNLTLEQKKELIKKNFEAKINNAVKNGKLTREVADKILKEFNEKLNSWDGTSPFKFKENLSKKFKKDFDKKFDNLTLEQKKELVKKHFENRLNIAVKNGRLTQDKADSLLKEFETKLNSWDGKKETLREIKKSFWEQFKPENTQGPSKI